MTYVNFPLKFRKGQMTLDSYQKSSVRTAKPLEEFDDRVTRGILGLCGESGEMADYWKKVKYQDHSLGQDHMVEELGDILMM